MTARFFLGVAEAAVVPGFSLITGIFYKRDEQPKRHVYFEHFSQTSLMKKLARRGGTSGTP